MTATKLLSDNGVSSGITGYQLTGGNDGTLQLQTTTSGGTATTAMTIDTSQNVGIGTSSPSFISGYSGVQINSSTGSVLHLTNSTTGATSTDGFDLILGNGSSDAYVWQRENANLIFGTNATERMRIDSSGNVGIGTSTPATKLQVDGVIRCNAVGGEGGHIEFLNTTNSAVAGLVDVDAANNTRVYALTNNPLIFGTNSTERARIDSSGYLQVGATSAPYTQGRINAMAPANSAATFNTTYSGDTSNAVLYITKYDSTTTTSQLFVRFVIGTNTSSGSGQITANGAGAAAFGSYSDSRLKENITDLPPQLANIMALRPVEYDYIESEGGGHQIGFIAQEVQGVYPDLIGERDDGMLTLTDLNKNDARLIKAIQEQQAIIEQLRADVAALKAKA